MNNYADRLGNCYRGAVCDMRRATGRPHPVLPYTLRALDPTWKVAGKVWTMGGHPASAGLDAHPTLLAWTGFLSQAPRGHEVICQPNDSTMAHMGELSAETLQARGVRGYIVDGGCRDTEFITKIGLRVWCRYATPFDIVARWVADRFGEPITIGNVTIRTGDYVLADRDGVVIIPAAIVDEVVTKTEEVLHTSEQRL